jgi:hypothetical protein
LEARRKGRFYKFTVELVEEEKLGGSFDGKFGIKREKKKRVTFLSERFLSQLLSFA